MSPRSFFHLIPLLGLLTCFTAQAESWVKAPHLQARLVAETEIVEPGQMVSLALVLKPDPGWHVYWKNPGDSGLPPVLNILQSGVKVGALRFPTPERIPVGPLVNFGYSGETIYLSAITLPKKLDAVTPVTIQAKWLVCEAECVPGKGEWTFSFRAGDQKDEKNQKKLTQMMALTDRAIARMPRMAASDLGYKLTAARVQVTADAKSWLKLSFKPKLAFTAPYFFPENREGEAEVASTELPRVEFGADETSYWVPLAGEGGAKVSGLFRINEKEAFEVNGLKLLVKTTQNLPAGLVTVQLLNEDTHARTSFSSFLIYLVMAFLGGVLLNLMPCVFPVLAIKVLSFLEHDRGSSRKVRAHGWAFTSGILVSFAVLGVLLYGFKQIGQTVGWGFQLQSPLFVGLLALVFFGFALNLFGLFEFDGPWLQRLLRLTTPKSMEPSRSGSFFTGILTSVASTPCSAPLMAPALGYGLSQTAWVGFPILLSVGLGLALPTLVLCYLPALLSHLPRPGIWMKRLKEILAFPLLATVIWLLWVLSVQVDSLSILKVLTWCLGLTYMVWAARSLKKVSFVITSSLVIALLVVAGAFRLAPVARQAVMKPVPAVAGGQVGSPEALAIVLEGSRWVPFKKTLLDEAIQKDRPVFIDFTAEWCVTCKVNEKLVLDSLSIQDAFARANVLLMRADWTSADPEVTEELSRHGRNSVPLYLWFPPGAVRPEIWPQVLSPSFILEKLGRLTP